jgi:protocatechuate 3,4-dioxygenase, alpha subunit
VILEPTPGQTVGPFFGFALPYPGDNKLVPPGHPASVRLHGRVLDGADQPVPDALIEIWQPDRDGVPPQAAGSLRRDGFTFTGWGRASTDGDGRYTFSTIAPGPTAPGAAAFFAICVFARGLLDRLFTRAYLPGDDEALANDPLLTSVAPDRRSTLVATRDELGFTFDIRLQGERETVFLEYS